jgi:hypothetical protein
MTISNSLKNDQEKWKVSKLNKKNGNADPDPMGTYSASCHFWE